MSDHRRECKVCAAVIVASGTICSSCVKDIQLGRVPKGLQHPYVAININAPVLPPQLMQTLAEMEKNFGSLGVSMQDAGNARNPGESDNDFRARIRRAMDIQSELAVGVRVRVTGGLFKGQRGTIDTIERDVGARILFDDGGAVNIAVERLEAIPDPAALRQALAELEEVTR